jgi:hypothetical protein
MLWSESHAIRSRNVVVRVDAWAVGRWVGGNRCGGAQGVCEKDGKTSRLGD